MEVASFPGLPTPECDMYMWGEPGIFSQVSMTQSNRTRVFRTWRWRTCEIQLHHDVRQSHGRWCPMKDHEALSYNVCPRTGAQSVQKTPSLSQTIKHALILSNHHVPVIWDTRDRVTQVWHKIRSVDQPGMPDTENSRWRQTQNQISSLLFLQ